MKKFILISLLSALNIIAADEIIETNVDAVNISNDADVANGTTVKPNESVETKVELEMEPEEKYIFEIQQPTTKTVQVFHASGQGFLRGVANLVTCPGELVRGFTYEYTARKWYVAVGTSFLAAFGGTGARLGAGAADIITFGTFGNVDLAEGFPDYVWQGAWVYKPPMAVPTKITSNPAVAAVRPDKDIIAGVKTGVIKSREQENTDFYKSKLPRNAY
jgi:hypothetical protein